MCILLIEMAGPGSSQGTSWMLADADEWLDDPEFIPTCASSENNEVCIFNIAQHLQHIF